ncbi:Ubiquitin--protein ligase [Handroanthus impetiginosus]|uniref:U-box domain-containing protein n=1 Tax=Handroanthus impetiginosus TaxID=429701 RepID=A0A2G9GNZ9_9LAMI|nr:Ubiquitin--protein ligase [Handroanthus impetiginosus]
MTFLWRRRRAGGKREPQEGVGNSDTELRIPTHYRCPISLDLMKDPVSLSTGITYDRDSIEKWIESGNVTCPVTNQILRNFDQIPKHAIRKMIQDWCVENKSYGVERIPTPRIPITPYECQELVMEIKNLAKESERNKRCIVNNGTGLQLANTFESFASSSISKHTNLLGEILSILTWTFPLDEEGISKLKSTASLRCMTWLMTGGDLSVRQNAIFVLKELISADQACINSLIQIEGIEEALFQIVKVPICPKSTQACLFIINHMIRSLQEKSPILKLVQMGLIPLILDIVVDGNKSTCEKALGVLDGICDLEEGRESVFTNALTIPLMVKKILRVSDVATQFCVSIIWKIRNENDKLVEAVQLGAFQKLLVVLQQPTALSCFLFHCLNNFYYLYMSLFNLTKLRRDPKFIEFPGLTNKSISYNQN